MVTEQQMQDWCILNSKKLQILLVDSVINSGKTIVTLV